MDSFNPPGIRPWHDMPSHGGCVMPIMGDVDGSLRCSHCGTKPRLTMGERRQGLRSERYWNKALEHKDQEAWWAAEYLRIWGEALKMRARRIAVLAQMELPDG